MANSSFVMFPLQIGLQKMNWVLGARKPPCHYDNEGWEPAIELEQQLEQGFLLVLLLTPSGNAPCCLDYSFRTHGAFHCLASGVLVEEIGELLLVLALLSPQAGDSGR